MTETQKWIETTVNYLNDMKDYAVWDLIEIKKESENAMKSISRMRAIAFDASERVKHFKSGLDTVYVENKHPRELS